MTCNIHCLEKIPLIEGNPSQQLYVTMTRGGNARRTESAFMQKMPERLDSFCVFDETMTIEMTIFANWTGDEVPTGKIALADSIPLNQVTLDSKSVKFAVKSSTTDTSVLTATVDVADILKEQVSSQVDETEPVLLRMQRKATSAWGEKKDCSARLKVTFSFDFEEDPGSGEHDSDLHASASSQLSLFSPTSEGDADVKTGEADVKAETVVSRSPRGRSVWEYECEAKDALITTLQDDITRLRT